MNQINERFVSIQFEHLRGLGPALLSCLQVLLVLFPIRNCDWGSPGSLRADGVLHGS